MSKFNALARAAAILVSFCALRAAADVIVTTNGSKIVGKITSIGAGTVVISTDYAGDIKVKQALVASIETDRPVAVRLENGNRVIGIVTAAEAGQMKIQGSNSQTVTPMKGIVEIWTAGEEDPQVVALRRKWSFLAGVDVNGESGTQHQMGTAFNFRATLKGPVDDLQLYTAYNRQVSNDVKSADQFKAGADYSDNFSDKTSWYVRDEAGYDRVMQITFDDVAAAGFGYDFIKMDNETLTGRAGLSYRDYQYEPGSGTQALNAIGGDLEVEYKKKFGRAELSDHLTYLPDFQASSNFIITHDFHFTIPITASLWKLAIGVTNDYDSKPVSGVSKIETLYYTRLELAWGAAHN